MSRNSTPCVYTMCIGRQKRGAALSRLPLACVLEASVADRGDEALTLATLERRGVEVRGVELLLQVVDAAELLGVVGLGQVLAERDVRVGLVAVEVRVVLLRVVLAGRAVELNRVAVVVVLVGLVLVGLAVVLVVQRVVVVGPVLGLSVVQVEVLLARVHVAGVSAVETVEPVAHLVVPLSPDCVGNDGKPPDGLFVSPKRATTSAEPLGSHY